MSCNDLQQFCLFNKKTYFRENTIFLKKGVEIWAFDCTSVQVKGRIVSLFCL
jgi:hypothetical protein